MFRLNNIKQNILIVAIAALLTGCGGGGGSSDSTIDTTITEKVVSVPANTTLVTEDSATIDIIDWIENSYTVREVLYGTTNKYGSTLVVNGEATITLYNLQANTTYHYKIVAEDDRGKKIVSRDQTFTTLEQIAEPIVTEPVPTEPILTEPVPTEPTPTEPIVTEPVPTEPTPTEPIVTEPAPTDPIVTEPAATEPTPVESNNPPEAQNVMIVGVAKVGETLTLDYTFTDIDGDSEGNSIIAWSTPTVEVQRGTSKTFTIPTELAGEEISAWVHPSDGTVVNAQGIQAANGYLTIEDPNSLTTEPIVEEAVVPITSPLIGARSVISTAVSEGTLFASPNGSGSSCTEAIPCSLDTANAKLSAGDVLFLRGGTYALSMDGLARVNIYASGTATSPIIIESYPGETAIIDGAALSPLVDAERQQGAVRLGGDYLRLRKIEVRNMPEKGILIAGDNCIVEGCKSYNNHLAGINAFDAAGLIIRDNTVYANSDVGLYNWNYDNGNNADGISASYSHAPLIEHNTVYGNSDDGIDCWGSNDSMLRYNISSDNGKLGGSGNGQGFKLGGSNNDNNQAHFNIAHSNASSGFDISESTNYNVQYINNVAWNNGGYGFIKLDNIGNIVENNIELDNGKPDYVAGIQSNNSWQRSGSVTFISTDPASPDFLRPTVGGGFEDIGVYAAAQ